MNRPADKPGYVPTGEGRYGECPDHGSRLWWRPATGEFFCPAYRGHDFEPYEIDYRDVYLEHNEAWRVVNGCLYVDTYDEMPEADSE